MTWECASRTVNKSLQWTLEHCVDRCVHASVAEVVAAKAMFPCILDSSLCTPHKQNAQVLFWLKSAAVVRVLPPVAAPASTLGDLCENYRNIATKLQPPTCLCTCHSRQSDVVPIWTAELSQTTHLFVPTVAFNNRILNNDFSAWKLLIGWQEVYQACNNLCCSNPRCSSLIGGHFLEPV